MRNTILKIIAIFIIGMVGGIFADQIFWPYFVERPLFSKYSLETPIRVTEEKEITIQENKALQNEVEEVKKIVVGIKSVAGNQVTKGSGFVVTSDGLVVTSETVVPKGSKATLIYNGEEIDSEVVKRGNDLVLMEIDKDNLPTRGFVEPKELMLGQRVFLVGKIVDGSKATVLVNQGIIKYFGQDNSVHTNIFETPILNGSPLFGIEGGILGLNVIDSQGKVTAISASEIRELLNS